MSETTTFNWSLAISAITLIVAIISPVLVSIVNNFHQTRIRKMELKYEKHFSYYQKQQEVFSYFIKMASKQLKIQYLESERNEYIRCYHELFLYTPSKYWYVFEKFHNSVFSSDKEIAKDNLSLVTKTLGEVLQESDLSFPKL